MYTTKATRLARGYGCRVFHDGTLVVEGRANHRNEIGAVFRDLLRTLDKLAGGDAFTSAARRRKWRDGNLSVSVKHRWPARATD